MHISPGGSALPASPVTVKKAPVRICRMICNVLLVNLLSLPGHSPSPCASPDRHKGARAIYVIIAESGRLAAPYSPSNRVDRPLNPLRPIGEEAKTDENRVRTKQDRQCHALWVNVRGGRLTSDVWPGINLAYDRFTLSELFTCHEAITSPMCL